MILLVHFLIPAGYQIQVSVNSGSFTVLIADTASTNPTASISGLTANTNYAFEVSVLIPRTILDSKPCSQSDSCWLRYVGRCDQL
jgi:hypothetical protein